MYKTASFHSRNAQSKRVEHRQYNQKLLLISEWTFWKWGEDLRKNIATGNRFQRKMLIFVNVFIKPMVLWILMRRVRPVFLMRLFFGELMFFRPCIQGRPLITLFTIYVIPGGAYFEGEETLRSTASEWQLYQFSSHSRCCAEFPSCCDSLP